MPHYLKSARVKHFSLARRPPIEGPWSKAFSRRTADPSNLQPVMHRSKIAVETMQFHQVSIFKHSLTKKKIISDQWINNHKQLDFMFLNETWLEDSCNAVLTETAPPNLNCISVCRTVRRGGGVAALFKDVYQCKQVSFDQYLSFEYIYVFSWKVLHSFCLSLFTCSYTALLKKAPLLEKNKFPFRQIFSIDR